MVEVERSVEVEEVEETEEGAVCEEVVVLAVVVRVGIEFTAVVELIVAVAASTSTASVMLLSCCLSGGGSDIGPHLHKPPMHAGNMMGSILRVNSVRAFSASSVENKKNFARICASIHALTTRHTRLNTVGTFMSTVYARRSGYSSESFEVSA